MYLTSKIQIFRKKRDVYKHAITVFTQVGVKQLNDFLRTLTAVSDLVDCTSINCELVRVSDRQSRFLPITISRLLNILRFFQGFKDM